MNRVLTFVWFAAGLLLAAPGAAAQPAPAPAAPQRPAEAAPAPPGKPVPPAPIPFTYDPAGRRDPFVSLMGKGSDPRSSAANRQAGVPGLLINEVNVKGIVRDRSGFIAMIQGTDNKTYIVRPGDKLLDGTVKAILPEAVVFSQDVNDPLSLVKQKEIRKTLRTSQEGRG